MLLRVTRRARVDSQSDLTRNEPWVPNAGAQDYPEKAVEDCDRSFLARELARASYKPCAQPLRVAKAVRRRKL